MNVERKMKVNIPWKAKPFALGIKQERTVCILTFLFSETTGIISDKPLVRCHLAGKLPWTAHVKEIPSIAAILFGGHKKYVTQDWTLRCSNSRHKQKQQSPAWKKDVKLDWWVVAEKWGKHVSWTNASLLIKKEAVIRKYRL